MRTVIEKRIAYRRFVGKFRRGLACVLGAATLVLAGVAAFVFSARLENPVGVVCALIAICCAIAARIIWDSGIGEDLEADKEEHYHYSAAERRARRLSADQPRRPVDDERKFHHPSCNPANWPTLTH